MKILVTGGAGFIGSNLVEFLADNHEVIVFDNFFMGSEKNLSKVKDKIKIVKGDIRDESLLNKETKDVDIIFNEAAASSAPLFLKDLRGSVAINIDGFINLLNACRKNDVKKLIYASTSSIYGNLPGKLREDMKVVPPNFYSVTKLADEFLAQLFEKEYGLKTVGFRYMSVYGPHEKTKGIYANLISQFLWDMQAGKKPVIYGDGSQTRDFVYVSDVVKANLLAMEKGNGIFNVGTGVPTSLNDLVKTINKVLETNIETTYIENKVKSYIFAQEGDVEKAKKELGFTASVSLEQGIRKLVSA